ncbi:hypothetical protein, partial [Terribacillus sp. AE2B 122]
CHYVFPPSNHSLYIISRMQAQQDFCSPMFSKKNKELHFLKLLLPKTKKEMSI